VTSARSESRATGCPKQVVLYLLDTDLIIDHLDEVPAATELIQRLSSEGVAISISGLQGTCGESLGQ
jgi:hypothetical protein